MILAGVIALAHRGRAVTQHHRLRPIQMAACPRGRPEQPTRAALSPKHRPSQRRDYARGLEHLSNVWVQTLSNGLVRVDQVTGIGAHQTPALTGKPSRWLLDVVLPVSIGSGHREGWGVTVLHRTLIQTSADPGNAAAALARLLAQLDLISAAGIITTSRGDQQPTGRPATAPDEEELVAEASQVRLRFVPFPHPAPGHNTGPEYL
jgi:hypothetical protein